MKRILLVALGLCSLLTVTSAAQERVDRNGVALRWTLIAPLSEGKEFQLNGRSYEPFMMGSGFGLEGSQSISEKWTFKLALSYTLTTDDTSATDNQSFKFQNTDNATINLKGLQLSLLAQYFLTTGSRTQPYLLGGLGTDIWWYDDRTGDAAPRSKELAVRAGIGVSHWLSEKMTLDIQGLMTWDVSNTENNMQSGFYGVTDWDENKYHPFRAHFQPSIGLTYFFGGGKDTDGDGIDDKKDNCENTPMGAIVDASGCPIDSDGDGVYDGLDQCPATPKVVHVDANGCPLDRDGDGVFDGIDQCPDTPPDVAVDDKGCPLDDDGDGVPNYRDRELDTPRGAKVDEFGVHLDTDADGVADGLDKCPGTPSDVEVDSTGCPKYVQRLTQKITLNIKYAPNSSAPDDAAKHVLDSIATILYAYPDTRIRVSGFTDSQGSDELNLQLSNNRANGVVDYLASKGVARDRMEARGFGEDPSYFIGDNETAEGRRLNRRVEIESIEQ